MDGGSSPLVRGGPVEVAADDGGQRLIPARAGRTILWAMGPTWRSAHPRSCGADNRACPRRTIMAGSSPLVRGGHALLPLRGGLLRLIPARAGRTLCKLLAYLPYTAHPRSCGADSVREGVLTPGSGSSPLVRGGPGAHDGSPSVMGLIPARAGRTTQGTHSLPTDRAHPRSCGADARLAGCTARVSGSSPLVRGGRMRRVHDDRSTRLIPARAGRTRCRRPGSRRLPAHPRSCGADGWLCNLSTAGGGSSPLVRGGREGGAVEYLIARLIPARAGRTSSSPCWAAWESAHPRSCGADACHSKAGDLVSGSSPLVRGGRCPASRPRRRERLIPARAGRTDCPCPPRFAPAAHPRSCGADALTITADSLNDGSSPLVRGGPLHR